MPRGIDFGYTPCVPLCSGSNLDARTIMVGGEYERWVSCLIVPLSNDILLLRCPGLLPQTFLILEILTAVPSGCLFTANSSLFPGSALQTHFPGPRPPLQQAIQGSSWDAQGRGIDQVRSSYLSLPSTDHPLRRPPGVPQKSLSVPAEFPPLGGFSKCGDLPSPSAPLCSLYWIPLLFFSFSPSTQLPGHFSCPFRCPEFSACVQQVLCELFHL